MEPDEDPAARTDELIARLRQRVEERREAGEYPAGLEDELDAHFRRIATQRSWDLDAVRASLMHLESSMAFSRARIPTDSNLPGGGAMHRAIGKAVSRQTQGVIEQFRTFAEAVRDALEALLGAMEFPSTHVHTDLVGQLDAVVERLSAYERAGIETVPAAELARRVEELEALEARRQIHPWFSNDAFEAKFRGSREELLDHYRDMAAVLAGCSPVIDIGCGRGEFLELLAEIDVEASGIEIDPDLVKAATDLDLNVEYGDGLQRLAGETDGSLGGIVLIQVVEHLTPQEVLDLVALAYEKLRPGGKILIETVNPQSLYTFAHSFYVDPTHGKPVHPAYLDFLFREVGFAIVELQWRSPPDEALQEVPDAPDKLNDNVRRLNRLVFGPQDYALIATR
jgi:SAM-dependent methyltransferase